MKTSFQAFALIVATTFSISAAEKDPLTAYPAAEKDQVRFVIQLPEKSREEEVNFKVEIIVGKEILSDSVNIQFAGGQLEEKTIEGWGYNYFELKKFGPVGSTLMAPPPGEKKVKRFVSTQGLITSYNSRLPVVVYIPNGCEVRYRIWSAENEFTVAEKK